MNMVKVGLIGNGWFGNKHVNVWMEKPGVELVAIADSASKNEQGTFGQDDFHTGSEERKEFTGITFQYLAELLDNVEVDVIDIVTPPETHFDLAITVIKAGKHVIIEKPIVFTYAECREIYRCAEEEGVLVFVNHVLRFDRRVEILKNMIDDEGFGKIIYGTFKRNFQSSAHYVYGNINPLYSALIHDIDLITHFTQANLSKVHGIQKSFLGRKEPDLSTFILELSDGSVFHVENHWHVSPSCPYGFENAISIYGEHSNCFQKFGDSVQLWTPKKVEYPDLFFWPNVNGTIEGALKKFLDHCARCLTSKTNSNLVGPNQILRTMQWLDTIEKSLKDEE